ncbi:MAG: ATP-binding protein [Acidobacteriota bacterium]
MFASLRTRLTLWYVGVLAFVLLLFSTVVYGLWVRSLNQRLDNGLRATLESIAHALERELAEDLSQVEEIAKAEGVTRTEAETALEKEATFSTVEDLQFTHQAIAVFDAHNRLLVAKPTADNVHAALPSFDLIPGESVNTFTVWSNEGEANYGLRVAVQRVRATPSNSYLIVVAQSLKANAEELRLLRRVFYLTVPLTILFAGCGGFLLVRKALVPVRSMSERARCISAENLEERLPVSNPRDELGKLADTFNELLTRLKTSFDQQRQFMADASHELRTPLSVLHTTAEVILEQPRRTEAEYRDALRLIDTQARRLTRVVEDMFTLARADAGRYPIHQGHFYLDELVRETAHAAQILAARKEVSVEVRAAVESPFCGDEDLLRRMLLNVLDNAIKFTPAGGNVRVSLARNNSGCEIVVEDSGTGIPSEAQANIFERFYRADKARPRVESNEGSGAGLGLSIARWVAEAHKGRLELRHSDESGSVFVASLPIYSPSR